MIDRTLSSCSASKLARRSLSLIGLVLLTLFVAGCAATGRGEFPALDGYNPGQHDLAVLSPVGIASQDLRSSILSHVNHPSLIERFRSVYITRNQRVEQALSNHFSGERVPSAVANQIREEVDADWILGFYIHEFSIKEFSKTETQTLYQTRSRYRNTSVIDNSSSDNGNEGRRVGPGDGEGRRVGPHEEKRKSDDDSRFISTRETEFTRRDIPVTTGQIRVVLSLSAIIYDVGQGEVIWRGRRIERAEDELADLSSIELKDIVVERVMYRIVSRLTA